MDCELDRNTVSFLATWLGESDTRKHRCPQQQVLEVIEDFFVFQTVDRLVKSTTASVCKVALQFPDDLLRFAPIISETLKVCTKNSLNKETEATARSFFYFILGDTSYGECCVDEVAGQHLDADIVVHYGNACLSPTRSIPALYVFPKLRFDDPERAAFLMRDSVRNVSSEEGVDRIVLLYDIDLLSCFGRDHVVFNNVSVAIESLDTEAVVELASPIHAALNKIINPFASAEQSSSVIRLGTLQFQDNTVPICRTAFIWFSKSQELDEWPPSVRNAGLKLCTGPQELCNGFYATSLSGSNEGMPSLVDSARLLRKRFALLSKAKDAERIGIVPGTLGVSGNVEVIDRCKRIIKNAGKRSYVLLVGKPNPSKLANFAEIDVFVLVACPQNSLLDNREYLRPILTPLELEAALVSEGDLFASAYSTDFRDLLDKKLDLPDNHDSNAEVVSDDAVAIRGDWSVSVTGEGGAAEYLKQRHWQGLSYDSGIDPEASIDELPLKAELGQSGIASRYDKEDKKGTNTPQHV